MNVFHADLDNTLIYSYKRELGPDKVCVEIYEGREISFITRRTAELLARASERTLLVPTTTRTVEQYNRIQLPIGTPPYALVCNGGVLLAYGEECDGWYRESLHLVESCQTELRIAESLLLGDPDVDFEVRNIRKLFLFTKSAAPERTVGRLRSELDMTAVDVFQNGKKVYVVPRKMDKGTAVRRLRDKLAAEREIGRVIAAGDSEFDVPMLWCADLPIAPPTLAQSVRLPACTRVMEGDGIFSEFVLEQVNENSV